MITDWYVKHGYDFLAISDHNVLQAKEVWMPEEAIAMVSLLGQLSPKQRAAVVLHYFADLPNEQTAEILGVTTATVRVHLSQGRRRLHRLLEEDDA